MIIGAIIVAAVFTYTFVGTLVAHRLGENAGDGIDHPAVFFGAVFWPVTVFLGAPISLGNHVARRLKRQATEQKALPKARIVSK